MRIKGNTQLRDRKEIEKHTKYKETTEIASHLSKVKKKQAEYKYYICDYCGQEIVIKEKWENRSGGIVTFPASLTGGYSLKLILCNKCLNAAVKEFTDKMVEDNYNHIPRID